MLDSMAELAGDVWTPQVAAAWGQALNLVASVMIDGAAEAERLAA
jgi:hemoglobin-like flavoprotein